MRLPIPINVRDITSTGSELREDREQPIRIAVFVDIDADDALVAAIQQALVPQTAFARLRIEAVEPGFELTPDSHADAVIALAGSTRELSASLAASRDQFVPTAVVTISDDRTGVAARLAHPLTDTIAAEDAEDAIHHLGAWLVDRVSHKKLALAANFAFMRRAVAEDAIKATALQNAGIGAIAILPGADMPLMTANQIKMVLQIAAAFGEPLGAERIKELAAVVGGAFVLRTVARQFVGLVPGFGWAIKGGIGYSATLAMGYAAVEYFESGADVRGLARKLADTRDKVMQRGEAPYIEASAEVVDQAASSPSPQVVPVAALPENRATGQ
jgi:uncharacterized protein (DUF697 family)